MRLDPSNYLRPRVPRGRASGQRAILLVSYTPSPRAYGAPTRVGRSRVPREFRCAKLDQPQSRVALDVLYGRNVILLDCGARH